MLGGNDGSRVTITLQRGKKNFPHKITLIRSQSLCISGEGEGAGGKRGSGASAVMPPHSLQPTSPRFMCTQESVVQPSQPSPRIAQQAHVRHHTQSFPFSPSPLSPSSRLSLSLTALVGFAFSCHDTCLTLPHPTFSQPVRFPVCTSACVDIHS
jgi:hypothetical protein